MQLQDVAVLITGGGSGLGAATARAMAAKGAKIGVIDQNKENAEKVAAELPKIAAEAGVSALVSKWEIAFKSTDVEYVDVTDRLVRLFNPTAKVEAMIAQAGTQAPIPLMEAVKTLRPDR